MSCKVLIFSSHGGGAHESARREIERIFQAKNWETRTIYPINEMEILGISLPEQNIYNAFLKRDMIVAIELSQLAFKAIYSFKREQIKNIIDRHVQVEKPNLIVSTIPIVNDSAIELAGERGLPYILVTVDRDLRNYFLPTNIHSECHIFVAHESNHSEIPRDFKIVETGFPIRQQFVTPILESDEQIRSDLGLSPQKNIVLLMMSAEGSDKLYQFAKKILQSNLEIQLVVFCGRNEQIKRDIDLIDPSERTTFRTLGFTQDIARCMKVAPLLVTKPGPMTMEEAIAMKCFMILDHTNTLSWEEENIRYALDRKIGYSLDSIEDLPSLIETHLKTSPSYPDDLPQNSFSSHFEELLDRL